MKKFDRIKEFVKAGAIAVACAVLVTSVAAACTSIAHGASNQPKMCIRDSFRRRHGRLIIGNLRHTEKIRHGYFLIPPIQKSTLAHFCSVVKLQCRRCVCVDFVIVKVRCPRLTFHLRLCSTKLCVTQLLKIRAVTVLTS